MNPFPQSERLSYVPVEQEHYDELRKIHTDPVVMQSIGGVRSEAKSKENFQSYTQHWETNAFGMYVITEKATQKFVGFGGLRDEDDTDGIEISYVIKSEYWGKGYGTEMVSAFLDYAYAVLRQERVVAVVSSENTRSLAILLKLGFSNTGKKLQRGTGWLDQYEKNSPHPPR